MGQRVSKAQRPSAEQPQPLQSDDNQFAPEITQVPPHPATASEGDNLQQQQQQVSAIVITICMLKMNESAADRQSAADCCCSRANNANCAALRRMDGANAVTCCASESDSCCSQHQQLPMMDNHHRHPPLVAAAAAAADKAGSGQLGASNTSTSNTPSTMARAIVAPPLIRMRDIAGSDSSADDDDDDDGDDEFAAAAAAAAAADNNNPASTDDDAAAKEVRQQQQQMPAAAAAVVDPNGNASASAAQLQRRFSVNNANNYKKPALAEAADNCGGNNMIDSPANGRCRSNSGLNNCRESAAVMSAAQNSTAATTANCGGKGGNSESAAAATIDISSQQQQQRRNSSSSSSSSTVGQQRVASKSAAALSSPQTAKAAAAYGSYGSCQHQQPAPAPAVRATATPPKARRSWKLNCAKLISGVAGNSSSSSKSPTARSVAGAANPPPAPLSPLASSQQTTATGGDQQDKDKAASSLCVCTAYRRMDERDLDAAAVPLVSALQATAIGSANIPLLNWQQKQPAMSQHSATASANTSALPATPQLQSAFRANDGACSAAMTAASVSAAAQMMLLSINMPPGQQQQPQQSPQVSSAATQTAGPQLGQAALSVDEAAMPRLVIHSQIDYVHCLVPDLQRITASAFYWGKMDRYEAERLLDGKPEGTFLLRDSAQDEFLFSVSFRKYNRSLHARIEQYKHKFSFDCHDPGVFTSGSVTGLLEHYKDPACVMFFEPALTLPLTRNFCFRLQELCRAEIVSLTTYDGVAQLQLPVSLRAYLREYHYRQPVKMQMFGDQPHAQLMGRQQQQQQDSGEEAGGGSGGSGMESN